MHLIYFILYMYFLLNNLDLILNNLNKYHNQLFLNLKYVHLIQIQMVIFIILLNK